MGIYAERVLPRIIDVACGNREISKLRALTTAGLSGTVVEIGFGSGLNVPHYPSEVSRVLAVEPADAAARRLSAGRVAASHVRVEHVGLDGQQIPLDDDSCDAAVCTFTLCTVPDAHRALRELRRVLKPGGRFHFLEHGLAPDTKVAGWQRRIEPVHRRAFGGCHLTRDMVATVEAAGFEMVDSEQSYMRGPKFLSWITRGVAA